MSQIKFFPTISEDLYSKLDVSFSRKFSFQDGDQKRDFEESAVDGMGDAKAIKLTDPSYKWDRTNCGLFLSLVVIIRNAKELFSSKNGVSYPTAKVGVGLVWKPDGSRVKNCIKLGEISALDEEVRLANDGIFIPDLNSNTGFSIVFFVSKPGIPDNQHFFGNKEGLVLGSFLAWRIIVSGIGSLFPVVLTSQIGGPLWRCHASLSRIEEDEFSNEDNIAVFINKEHPLYPFIDKDSPLYNKDLFKEVFSSALAFLIIQIKESCEGGKIDFSKSGEKGSVLVALKYFQDERGFAINSNSSELLASIKKYFEEDFN